MLVVAVAAKTIRTQLKVLSLRHNGLLSDLYLVYSPGAEEEEVGDDNHISLRHE